MEAPKIRGPRRLAQGRATPDDFSACVSVGWRDLGDQVVVVDVHSSAYFVLTNLESELWRQLLGGHGVCALSDYVSRMYRLPKAQAIADVTGFLQELQEAGLIGASPAFGFAR